ncbi:MAG: hypothetical protein WCJ30_05075, partial [Deltaproteobacteria bacterium]
MTACPHCHHALPHGYTGTACPDCEKPLRASLRPRELSPFAFAHPGRASQPPPRLVPPDDSWGVDDGPVIPASADLPDVAPPQREPEAPTPSERPTGVPGRLVRRPTPTPTPTPS